MDIGIPFRDLGPVEIAGLRDAVRAQGETAWDEHDLRQKRYDVHHDTRSIVLLFCAEAWPDPEVRQEAGWSRLAAAAMPVIDAILAAHYPPGGTILRAMAARLEAGGTIRPHVDALESFRHGHRIHVPLVSNPGVRFTVDGRPCPMTVGHAWEINNQRQHSVMNRGSEDRISFIFDYVPPAP